MSQPNAPTLPPAGSLEPLALLLQRVREQDYLRILALGDLPGCEGVRAAAEQMRAALADASAASATDLAATAEVAAAIDDAEAVLCDAACRDAYAAQQRRAEA